MKRVILLALGSEPVAELVPEAVRGLSRIALGLSEFVRRPDLETDTSIIFIELPREAIAIADRNVVRWFDQ
jgi:hypothetical protein